MERPFAIRPGTNSPVWVPLFDESDFIYSCTDRRIVSAWAEADEALIKKYLEPTPFEYVANVFRVSIIDNTNATGHEGFMECTFTIPVKYGDTYGGYTMFAYTDEDFYCGAAREMWGYPHALADKIELLDHATSVVGIVTKHGREVIRVEVSKKHGQALQVPDVKMDPHLILQVIPNGDGPGELIRRVLTRDPAPDFNSLTQVTGQAALTLRYDEFSFIPWDEFALAKTLCGTYERGDYHATDEYAWAKELAILTWPDHF